MRGFVVAKDLRSVRVELGNDYRWRSKNKSLEESLNALVRIEDVLAAHGPPNGYMINKAMEAMNDMGFLDVKGSVVIEKVPKNRVF
jgi:hypothetical protein